MHQSRFDVCRGRKTLALAREARFCFEVPGMETNVTVWCDHDVQTLGFVAFDLVDPLSALFCLGPWDSLHSRQKWVGRHARL